MVAGRSRTPPVGGLTYDRSLVADTGLVATVAAPLELAIDNRRLVVDLRAAVQQLDEAAAEIRTSRRRIVVAADANVDASPETPRRRAATHRPRRSRGAEDRSPRGGC